MTYSTVERLPAVRQRMLRWMMLSVTEAAMSIDKDVASEFLQSATEPMSHLPRWFRQSLQCERQFAARLVGERCVELICHEYDQPMPSAERRRVLHLLSASGMRLRMFFNAGAFFWFEETGTASDLSTPSPWFRSIPVDLAGMTGCRICGVRFTGRAGAGTRSLKLLGDNDSVLCWTQTDNVCDVVIDSPGGRLSRLRDRVLLRWQH